MPDRSARSSQSERLILESARIEVVEQGILGLRVAEVAARANCSITQIYRYFGDRNGLLARVLGDIYEESIEYAFSSYYNKMKAFGVITVDDIIDSLVLPSQYAALKGQEVRLQILAASVNNVELRERIKKVSQDYVPKWDEGLDYIEAHLEPGTTIDRRVFTIMLLLQNMYYRTLLDDKGFTDEEYRQFIREKIVL